MGCCRGKNNEIPVPPLNKTTVGQYLAVTYENKIAPMEKRHSFEHWYTPVLMAGEFRAKPMVLFLGQYSVGKTSMIRYLMGGKEYPGSRIGPEPTTDCFVVVHHGVGDRTTPGTTLTLDATMPFQTLNMFGGAFLNHLKGATVDAPLLKHVYLIDTPGILSGQQQQLSREYDFANVTRYIADKVDMIILLFDTSKLDISDEYKNVLLKLKGYEDKIKIVLNKADSVGLSELVRVRGALMWSLSKIIQTPEVPKVYVGSFDGSASKDGKIMELFKDDYVDLFKELQRLPAQILARRVNDIINRAKNVRIHALLMDEIMKKMWWRSDAQLLKQMTDVKIKSAFAEVKQRYRFADSDMPQFEHFKRGAAAAPLRLWQKVDLKMLFKLEEFLTKDIPQILENMPDEDVCPQSMKKMFREMLSHQNIEFPSEKKKVEEKQEEEVPQKPEEAEKKPE